MLAFGLLLVLLALSAQRLGARYIHGLAPLMFPQKQQGVLLQQEAFRHPDLLPIYGSSELLRPSLFHGAQVFAHAPTGFALFPLGSLGTPPLAVMQSLAAVGPGLRGRKLVVSLSPSMFVRQPNELDRLAYGGNFSRLKAGELVFSDALDFGFKQRAARRLLDFPATIEDDPFLHVVLARLVSGGWAGRVLYWAALPFGRVQNGAFRLGDGLRVLQRIHSAPGLEPDVPREPATLDWAALTARADSTYRTTANNNPFGIENGWWDRFNARFQSGADRTTDAEFIQATESSPTWTDLELVLELLRRFGAEPLVLSMPLKGRYIDYTGASAAARATYYRRLEATAARYGVPLVDFASYDDDPYFLHDEGGHPSPKGWVLYDAAMDRFYHDSLR